MDKGVPSASSTKLKRSFYRRKFHCRETTTRQSASSAQTTTSSMPDYLTSDKIQKGNSKISSIKFGDIQIKQVERKGRLCLILIYFRLF